MKNFIFLIMFFSLLNYSCSSSIDEPEDNPNTYKTLKTWEDVITPSAFNNKENLDAEFNYYYPWGRDHNGTARMYGYPDHVYPSGGVLTLTAVKITWDEGSSTKDPYLPIHYHSGAVHAKDQIVVNDQFPNWEIKVEAQAPSTLGTWPAFWITGVNSWPPESDIMEFKGNNVCWQNTYDGSWQTTKTTVSNPGSWHTYRIWMTKINSTDVDIHYYIDGVWKAKHTAKNFVNKPMWLILNLQMEGSSGSPGPTTSTTLKFRNIYVGRTRNY